MSEKMVNFRTIFHPIPEVLQPNTFYMVASPDGDLNQSQMLVTDENGIPRVRFKATDTVGVVDWQNVSGLPQVLQQPAMLLTEESNVAWTKVNEKPAFMQAETVNQFITTTGVEVGGNLIIRVPFFTSGRWVAPRNGWVTIFALSAGGASSNVEGFNGGGSGSWGYIRRFVEKGDVINLIIGAAGIPAANTTTPPAGGATTIEFVGKHIATCPGGMPGKPNNQASGFTELPTGFDYGIRGESSQGGISSTAGAGVNLLGLAEGVGVSNGAQNGSPRGPGRRGSDAIFGPIPSYLSLTGSIDFLANWCLPFQITSGVPMIGVGASGVSYANGSLGGGGASGSYYTSNRFGDGYAALTFSPGTD